MMVLDSILQALWLLLPAGAANMSPVLFKWIPFLDIPIDANKKWKGKPVFGRNKTYRGFFFAIIFAIIVVYIQTLLYPYMQAYSVIDYSHQNVFLLGFLFGFGAMFGDLIESFFKRRVSIESGNSWFPFDQIDWILGSMLFIFFVVRVPILIIVIALVLFAILHPTVNYIGYLLKIKKTKF